MKTFSIMGVPATTALLLSSGMAMTSCTSTTSSTRIRAAVTKTPPISKDGTKSTFWKIQPNKAAAASPQKNGADILFANKDLATSPADASQRRGRENRCRESRRQKRTIQR